MPCCYQLVGVPGSGKSTWLANQLWTGNCAVVGTDEYVERFARRLGQSYSQVFNKVMPRCVRLMTRSVARARALGQDIVWDQTSTTRVSRRKKFNMLPDYEHVAVVFGTPATAELKRRLRGRPGKKIPWKVVAGMIEKFEQPTEHEGFKEVWYAG